MADTTRTRKIFVISGVNSPLGSAIASWALEEGSEVIGTIRCSSSEPQELGDRIRLFLVDFSNSDSIKVFADQVERIYGRVDCLVNNVSSWHPGGILSQELSDVRHQLDASIGGTIELTTRLAGLLLRSEDARIINICSTAGTEYRWSPNTTYVTLKSAISAFGHSLQRELSGSKIKVTNIHLGRFQDGCGDEIDLMKVSDIVKGIALVCGVSTSSVVNQIVMTPSKYEY